jgi:hypothetical protein
MNALTRAARQKLSEVAHGLAMRKDSYRELWQREEDKAGSTQEAANISHITEHVADEARTSETMSKNLRPNITGPASEVYKPEKQRSRG